MRCFRAGLQDDTGTLVHHVPCGGLRHEEYASQVHIQHFVPFLRRDLEKIVTNTDSGVVDQHVDAPHAIDGFSECGPDLVELRNVGSDYRSQLRQLLLNPCACIGTVVDDADCATFFERNERCLAGGEQQHVWYCVFAHEEASLETRVHLHVELFFAFAAGSPASGSGCFVHYYNGSSGWALRPDSRAGPPIPDPRIRRSRAPRRTPPAR